MNGDNGQRRVVVTGIGAVTPLGTDVESSWAALTAGKSGAGPITQFDSTGFASTFACASIFTPAVEVISTPTGVYPSIRTGD